VPERATELLRELFDGCRLSIRGRCRDVFEHSLDDRERERVPLEDERAKARNQGRHLRDLSGISFVNDDRPLRSRGREIAVDGSL
jgi:hypothetical protein